MKSMLIMTIYVCCVCLLLPEPLAPHAMAEGAHHSAVLELYVVEIIITYFVYFFSSFNSCALGRFCCHFEYVVLACSTYKTLAMSHCLAVVCERGDFEKCILFFSLAADVVFLFAVLFRADFSACTVQLRDYFRFK